MYYVYALLRDTEDIRWSLSEIRQKIAQELSVLIAEKFNAVPFYIGMGKGRRFDRTALGGNPHKMAIISTLISKYGRVVKIKIAYNMNKREACDLEIMLIRLIGRRCIGGPLTNLTEGGDGFIDLPPEVIARRTASLNKPEIKNRILSVLHSATVREKSRLAMRRPDVRYKLSVAAKKAMTKPEVKKKLRDGAVRRWSRPEEHLATSQSIKAGMADASVRANLSEKARARWSNQHERDAASKKRHAAWASDGPWCWITDGITNRLCLLSVPIPEGWYQGRTVRKHGLRHRFWITNGKDSRLHREDEVIPDSWSRGRTV
jgi:hypothetical protein